MSRILLPRFALDYSHIKPIQISGFVDLSCQAMSGTATLDELKALLSALLSGETAVRAAALQGLEVGSLHSVPPVRDSSSLRFPIQINLVPFLFRSIST